MTKISELKAALVRDPENGELHARLAWEYEKEKEIGLAVDELRTAIEKDFNIAGMHYDLSRIYLDSGDQDKAFEECRLALGLKPGDGRIHAQMGDIYRVRNEFNSAIEEYSEALDKGYRKREVYEALSGIYGSLGEYDRAAGILKDALGAASENTADENVHISLGKIYRDAGDTAKSLEEFDKAMKRAGSRIWFKNWMLNEKEITEKKDCLESGPRKLVASLTSRCNLECVMCSKPAQHWDIPRNTAEEIKSMMPSLETVDWTGGEVFLYEGFDALFSEAIKHEHLHQNICTNGLLVDEAWVRRFIHCDVNLLVSVNGLCSETYEKIHKGASFGDIRKKLDMICSIKGSEGKKSGMKLGMHMVVMEENAADLEHINDFLEDHGFDILIFMPWKNCENGGHPGNRHVNIDEEYLGHIIERGRQKGIEVASSLPAGNPSDEAENTAATAVPGRIRCLWPWQQLTITTGGKITLHCGCMKTVGDTARVSLAQAWNSPEARSVRKSIVEDRDDGSCGAGCIPGGFAARGQAIAVPEKVCSIGSRDAYTHVNLGRLYRDMGRMKESADEFRRALADIGDSPGISFRNRLLNEMEISEGRVILESMPTTLNVSLTSRCNISCVMCEVIRGDWELPPDTAVQVRDLMPYLERISWTGGEVFLYPGFRGLLEEASSHNGLRQDICTNGLLLDRQWLGIMADADINLTVSIDGLTRPTYERIRKGADYGKLAAILELIGEYSGAGSRRKGKGLEVSMQMVVMEENYRELAQAADFMKKYGIGTLYLVSLGFGVPGCNGYYEKDKPYIMDAVRDLCRRALPEGLRIVNRMTVSTAAGEKGDESGRSGREKSGPSGGPMCLKPWRQLMINSKAEVISHCYCLRKVGAVGGSESLRDIWNGEGLRELRKKILAGNNGNICNPNCFLNVAESELRGPE
ncbi:MAG: radical SAM protein [Elusimicrobia bacterium]|nr:radical SAM protein [Elusimicrobiota bacterium]